MSEDLAEIIKRARTTIAEMERLAERASRIAEETRTYLKNLHRTVGPADEPADPKKKQAHK